MNSFRAFIAIHLPSSTQEKLIKYTLPLRQAAVEGLVRWVPPQNLHLTLKFLGIVPISHIDFLKQMMVQAVDSFSGFSLQTSGLGAFPNIKQPLVLWVGIHAPNSLKQLHLAVEEGATRLGYPKEERAFSPHLTLGRVRQKASSQELSRLSTLLHCTQLGKIEPFQIDSIHLYKSDLSSDGSVYTKLFSTFLR